ncbi:MAG TPA: thiamine pyrophosphate-dependent enzyme [Vicinamibacterales bacterium]|nr:thiamine pyrophosphate-dependent enzyme [Vicinamibacterales bacterium]
MTLLRQVNFDLPPDEVLAPGHMGCAGCGAALAMRIALKALGRQTVLVIPACCWSVIDGPSPYSAASVPVMHTPFASAAAAASGVRAALDLKGDTETNVCAWAGDGGTFDIGIQALSAAAERNENILYICYDNEAYMNTGVQRSSATPLGAWTTTTPGGRLKEQPKKDLLAIMAAHGIPYAATGTVAFPDDLAAKLTRARGIRGTKFLHVLAPCPPGWKIPPEQVIAVARMAVMARVFPLVEIEHGTDWRITLDPGHAPLEEYLKTQGRFRFLLNQPETLEAARAAIEDRWQRIINRTGQAICG